MREEVILVDNNDNPIGSSEKLKAHAEGLLHRAFSVFVFNSDGEMLLQRRHSDKYHSGGLWSNACCSHPRPGEDTGDAARRRLAEEVGIDSDVERVFSFVYRVELGELVEHEYDHVFVADYDGPLSPNPAEVDGVQWIGIQELRSDLQNHPERYTYWFRHAFERVCRTHSGREFTR